MEGKPRYGQVIHINVPCLELRRAQKFYGKVFGWTFTPNTENYVLFSDCGGIGGGLAEGAQPSKDGICFFVNVPDIPATLDLVTAAGGTVELERTPASGPGYYASFVDTEGNRVGIYCDD